MAGPLTPAERQVRKAQRQYVEVWVGVLRELNPELAEAPMSSSRTARKPRSANSRSAAHSRQIGGAS
ncbi:hypothetical protein MAHJHV28_47290 [Mycobacterium avium subsp. hominissuis]